MTTTHPHTSAAPTAVVTGANKGLGRETARRLLAAGYTVYVGSRDAARGQQTADDLGARLLLLDVTDDTSVRDAATQLDDEVGHLDVLVNNAGVVGDVLKPFDQVTAADLIAVYETNVFGAVRVIQALLPLLRAAEAPVIVNVSSGTGSMYRATDPESMESALAAIAYPSSKAALNMITVQYAKALPGARINAVDPGYTATDATGGRGQNITDGTDAIVAMAQVSPDGPTGVFVDAAGTVPW